MVTHREGVVCVAVQRAALVDFVLQGQGEDEGDVLRVLQLDGIHPEGDVLALCRDPPPTPGVQERPHPGRHHLHSGQDCLGKVTTRSCC